MSNLWTKPLVIGLAGQKQSGKSTAAEFIRVTLSSMKVVEYSFADKVKRLCIDILGLEHHHCYGDNAAKDMPTQYMWEDVAEEIRLKYGNGIPMTGVMSGRHVMQLQGELQRRMFCEDLWIRLAVDSARRAHGIDVAVFSDIRHKNEVKFISNIGHIIFFAKRTNNSKADSEREILEINWPSVRNCHIIDNTNMTIADQNAAVHQILEEMGLVGTATL